MEKYARKCDVTGRGMNHGYVVMDGEQHFSEQKYLIDWLRSRGGSEGLSDEFLLNESFDLDEWYFTEWQEVDEDSWFDADGNEYRMVDGKQYQIKNKVSASAFLEWYFDDETPQFEACNMVDALMSTGQYSITARELFNRCGYIPQHICYDCPPLDQINYTYAEYLPSEVEFIDDVTNFE